MNNEIFVVLCCEDEEIDFPVCWFEKEEEASEFVGAENQACWKAMRYRYYYMEVEKGPIRRVSD